MNWLAESAHKLIQNDNPSLFGDERPASQRQALKHKHALAVVDFSQLPSSTLLESHRGNAHLDDGLRGLGRRCQQSRAIMDEIVDSSESLSKCAVILCIEDLWDDFEHLLLGECD